MEEHRRSKEVTGVQRGNTTTAITKARGVGTAKDTVLDTEGNKVIHDTLDEIYAIIRASKADPSSFDAEKLRKIMEDFREPLVCY